MPKYYIGELQGLRDDFVFYKYTKHSSNLQNQIYDAPKEKYGNFIFTKTLGGFNEVITGRTFKFIEKKFEYPYPYLTAPINTGVFVDKDNMKEVSPDQSELLINNYFAKYNKEELNTFFDKVQRKSDRVLPTGNNKSEYFAARLLGLKDDFKPINPEDIRYSIFEAEKEDYGEFLFKKTLNGYEEILTGKTFKFQVEEPDDTGYPSFDCPKDTGLLVDRNSEHMIPKAFLDKELEEYKNKHNKEQLSQYFDEIQLKSDSLLKEYLPNKKRF